MKKSIFRKDCSKNGLRSYGDPAGTRTPDPRLKRQLLYRLSYWVIFLKNVAGMVGFEPTSEGVKVPCLATWLHPCVVGEHKVRAGAKAPALCLICVGWVMGFEPTTPGTTIRCSNQLSYTHHIYLLIHKGKWHA